MHLSADALNQIVWVLIGVLIVVIAFALRVSVNVGRSPGGVDTWYYLAYADAVRHRPGLDVRLPQYLLQDEKQSYPPLFPSLLALLPQRWLRRWFWTVAPAVDCLHLLLLYWMAFKITDNLMVSALTACLYAFTPQLVSETRSLNGRSLGALLHSLAVLGALRYVMSGEAWPWLALALVFGAALFLSSATSSAAYAFVCGVLSLIDSDPRYLGVACGAALLATLVSGGHFVRVIGNYVSALAYWRRNRRRFGLTSFATRRSTARAAHRCPRSAPASSAGTRPTSFYGCSGRTRSSSRCRWHHTGSSRGARGSTPGRCRSRRFRSPRHCCRRCGPSGRGEAT